MFELLGRTIPGGVWKLKLFGLQCRQVEFSDGFIYIDRLLKL